MYRTLNAICLCTNRNTTLFKLYACLKKRILFYSLFLYYIITYFFEIRKSGTVEKKGGLKIKRNAPKNRTECLLLLVWYIHRHCLDSHRIIQDLAVQGDEVTQNPL